MGGVVVRSGSPEGPGSDHGPGVLEADYSIVGQHQVGQIISSSELGVHGCQVLLGDLTGPRTRNSDIDRDLGPNDLVE